MADEPREPRSAVIIRALVDVCGVETPGTATERRVRNLSRAGACIDNDGTLTTGMILRLTMGSITGLEAEVMWANPRLAGVRFGWPVDLEQARRPRGSDARFTPSAGWVVDVADPYRRYG